MATFMAFYEFITHGCCSFLKHLLRKKFRHWMPYYLGAGNFPGVSGCAPGPEAHSIPDEIMNHWNLHHFFFLISCS